MTPDGPNTVGPQTVTYTIEITGCSLNTVQKETDLPNYEYFIGSPALVIPGSFDTGYLNCEVTYTLDVVTTGVFNPISVSFDSSSPDVTVEYDLADMAGTTLALTLTATSVVSGDTAVQEFDVKFMSGCENLELLSSPLVMQSSFSFDLWE